MVESNYADAYSEAYAILMSLEKSDFNKIPNQVIEVIRDNANPNYKFIVTNNIEEMRDKIHKETKAILFNIFRDYLANEEQKEKIMNWQKADKIRIEEEKRNNILNKSIFHNSIEKKPVVNEELALVNIESDSKWKKIFNKIKELFMNIIKRK